MRIDTRLGRAVISSAVAAGLVLAALATAAPASAATRVTPSSRWTSGQVAASSTASYVVRPTRTATYLITVGDVTADVVLTVSDSRGHVLARSDHRGARAFEQAVRRLREGRRYVVRVTAVADAARFSLRVMPLRPGVYVLDRTRVQRYDSVHLNSSDLVGEILNNTSASRTLTAPISYTFRSRSGALLPGHGSFRLTRQTLPPRSLTAFTVTFTPQGWWSATARMPGTNAAPAAPTAPASAYTLTIGDSPFGGTAYTVTNRSRDRWVSVAPRLVRYGLRGTVVEVVAENWNGGPTAFSVAPGATGEARLAGLQSSSWTVSWTERAAAITVG